MSELDLSPLKFAYNAVITADDKTRVLVGAFPLLVGEIERLRGELCEQKQANHDLAMALAIAESRTCPKCRYHNREPEYAGICLFCGTPISPLMSPSEES